MRRVLVLCCIALAGAGCLPAMVSSPAPRARVQGDSTGVSWFHLTPVTHNAEECIYGIDRVETYVPAWGAIISFVTLGIATPITIEYKCTARPDEFSEEESKDPFKAPPHKKKGEGDTKPDPAE
jgi:hypothetical protein